MSPKRGSSQEKTSSQETVTDSQKKKGKHRARREDQEGEAPGSPSNTYHPAEEATSSGTSREDRPAKGSSREAKMGSSSKRHHDSSSKKHSSKSKSGKSDDWSEVAEPEERRRIQNRIAQRKFREKAKEAKDRADRDAQNQEHAGSSYHVPAPDELADDDGAGGMSGLPWGSINLRYVVAQGHESASGRGGRRGGRAGAGAAADGAADLGAASAAGYGGGGGGLGDYVVDDGGSSVGPRGFYDMYGATGGSGGSSAIQSLAGYGSYGDSHDDSPGGGGDFFDDSGFYYPEYPDFDDAGDT